MKTAPRFKGRQLYTEELHKGNLVTTPDGRCFIGWGKVCEDDEAEDVKFFGIEVDPATVEQIGGDLFEENKRLRELIEETLKRRDDTSPEIPHYYLEKGYEALKEK